MTARERSSWLLLAGGRRRGRGGASAVPGSQRLAYLDSLLMTLMRAPFSSFSLWLSDFSSVRTCGREGKASQSSW